MDIKVEQVDIFGTGVQAFRITADTPTVPLAPAVAEKKPEPLTEDTKRLAEELREQFQRDLDSRW